MDKPPGITSNQMLQSVKRLLHACKAGHTGSLDPIATGLLPLCFGEATKLSQFMLTADKRYWVRIRLGVATDTYDSEGETIDERPVNVSKRTLEKALDEFRGEIEQIPPMYSAVKHQGQSLYKLAREGKTVERTARRVRIDELHLLELTQDSLTLEIACSKGTYIRSLAHDLGERLGCGAHVIALKRLSVGSLQLDQAIGLSDFEALDGDAKVQRLLPLDAVLTDMPAIQLTALASHYLRQGQPVTARHEHDPGWVRLYDNEQRFLGVGEVMDDGRVGPRRLLGNGRRL
jgi:tRNA pseudouridine55 synthase